MTDNPATYHLAVVTDATLHGGAERMLEVLVGALPATVKVTVVGQDQGVVARVAAARAGTVAVTVPANVRALRWLLRDVAPDVVHLNLTSMRSCRPAAVAALSLRLPTVLVDHLPMPGLRWRGRVLQRVLTRCATVRISVGYRSSRAVEDITGLPPGTVATIHNGIPPLPVSVPEPVPGQLRVAALCRLVPDKGLEVLLHALVEVPEVGATVAGAGPLEPELRRLAGELGLGRRVRFLGWSDPAEVLGTVDAVVVPSRNEGLPVVLLEAMHAGFPVVATPVGSIPEVLEDGVTGLLVPPDDPAALANALRRLAASPSLRAGLGAAARERARTRFSVAVMSRAYDAVYAAAAGRAGRAEVARVRRGSGDGPVRRPRALVTLPEPAEPVDTGKRHRAAAVLRALAVVADLDVVVLHADHPLDLRPVPPDVPTRHWSVVRKRRRSRRTALLRMIGGLPWQVALQDWTGPRAELARLRPSEWDVVWFGALDHFVVLRHLVAGIPTIVDYDDVEPAKIRAFLAVAPRDVRGRLRRLKGRVESVYWRRYERLADRHAAALVVCSDLDVARLHTSRGVAVPNTYPDPGPPTAGPPSIPPEFVMIANYGYVPNVYAAGFAAHEVLPVLRRALPDAVVHLAGRGARRYLGHLAAVPGLRLTDPLPDVRPLLERATAVIAPVRYGGGTRVKIIEAFAHAVPVVSTTLGAEGLEVRDGIDVLLADDGAAFAAACVRLARDARMRARLAAAGRRHYEAAFRPDVAEAAVANLVAAVLAEEEEVKK